MGSNNQSSQEPQLTQANHQVLETTCSICQQGFQLTEAVYACPFCHGFHHAACWETRRQCPAAPVAPTSPEVSAGLPGAEIPPAMAAYAPFGTGAAPDGRQCPACGKIIRQDALKCLFCGEVFDPHLMQSAAAVPGLHWGIVLVLSIVTCGIFLVFWMFRQAYWARKVDSSNHALLFYGLYLGLAIFSEILSADRDLAGLAVIVSLAGVILGQAGNFSVKQTIESHSNRTLSGVMTFFFGALYHQYHFNEIAKGSKGKTTNLSILNA